MLYRFTPEELRFIMIDPKVVEMQVYNDAAASRHPGRDRSEEGAARVALGDRRDGKTLQDFRQDRRAQHHQASTRGRRKKTQKELGCWKLPRVTGDVFADAEEQWVADDGDTPTS